MATSLEINGILTQVKKLDKADQVNLFKKLSLLLKKAELVNEPALRLTSLSGLGNKIWDGVNIDNYVDQERQW